MNKPANTGKLLYAVALAGFGIQHLLYAGFVATLVPAWLPWHLFWAYFTAGAFITASLSILFNKLVNISAALSGIMFALFIILIHIPHLANDTANPQAWTRAIQDLAIMSTAFMLTGYLKLNAAAQIIYAGALLVLGLQHLSHTVFVTAKVPAYFPVAFLVDYLVAIIISALAVLMIINRYGAGPAILLGVFLLLFALLYHIPLLIKQIDNGQAWTAALLDIMIAGGALIASGVNWQQRYFFVKNVAG